MNTTILKCYKRCGTRSEHFVAEANMEMKEIYNNKTRRLWPLADIKLVKVKDKQVKDTLEHFGEKKFFRMCVIGKE